MGSCGDLSRQRQRNGDERDPSREGLAVPAFAADEFGDGFALQLAELLHGLADGDDRADGDVVREAEELFHGGFLADGHGGENAAESLVAGGEEDVPGEGIDGGAARDTDAVE